MYDIEFLSYPFMTQLKSQMKLKFIDLYLPTYWLDWNPHAMNHFALVTNYEVAPTYSWH